MPKKRCFRVGQEENCEEKIQFCETAGAFCHLLDFIEFQNFKGTKL